MRGSGLKRFAAYALLGIVLYLAFLLATVPAAWVAAGAARLTGGTLLLADFDGTLWHGTGELHAGQPPGGVRALGTLRWQLSPWRLLLGAAQLDLSLEGQAVRAEGVLRVGHDWLEARDVSATAPAALASLAYGPVAFFDPRGTIELRVPQLELSGAGLVTDAEVRWRGAGGRFTGERSFGDYRLQLDGRGETAHLDLSTLRGDLELTGQGRWQVTGNGAFRFTGSATPRANAAPELEALLRALGPDRGNGRRDLRLNARLPLVQMLGF